MSSLDSSGWNLADDSEHCDTVTISEYSQCFKLLHAALKFSTAYTVGHTRHVPRCSFFHNLGCYPEEPLLVPITEFTEAQHKRQTVQGLPLLAVLESPLDQWSNYFPNYLRFSPQVIQDLQQMARTILTLQDQIDWLATVVLQNWQGLDILIAKKDGPWLFLIKECCFYATT